MELTTNVTSNKACLNDVVFFNCSAADANPAVALYQFFENDVLFGSSSSGMFSKMVMNSGNLTYKCVANNTAGTQSSQYVAITVSGKNDCIIKKIGCVLFSLLFGFFVSSLLVIVYHFLPGVSRASRLGCMCQLNWRYLKPYIELNLHNLSFLINQQFFRKRCTVDSFRRSRLLYKNLN